MVNRKSYRSPKFNLAMGIKLAGKRGSKKKTPFSLNLGVLGKYNQTTDRIKGGLGITAQGGIFSIGISSFYDDYIDEYENKKKNYRVASYTAGVKWGGFIFDYNYTESFSKRRSRIHLISGAMFIHKFIFSGGRRFESSYRPKYRYKERRFMDEKDRKDSFYGVQYSFNGHFLIGAYFNYYLVRDLTLGLTFLL